MSYKKDVKKIYNNRTYVEKYPELHIFPAHKKHAKNISNLNLILRNKKDAVWLDVCCGSAWHFSHTPSGGIKKIGIDISHEHLKAAKQNNPDSEFICDDFLDYEAKERTFDLVTCFWGSYCYLNTEDQISSFINKMITLTSDEGTLYIEVVTPHTIGTFSGSRHERESSSSIEILNESGSRWKFIDAGGEHVMLSPPLESVLEILKETFANIRVDSNCYVHHLICKDKKTSLDTMKIS